MVYVEVCFLKGTGGSWGHITPRECLTNIFYIFLEHLKCVAPTRHYLPTFGTLSIRCCNCCGYYLYDIPLTTLDIELMY